MNPEAYIFVPNNIQQPSQTLTNNNSNNNINNVKNANNNGIAALTTDFANKLSIDTTSGAAYNHEVVIQDAVKFQIEYHFSDTNLSMDNYLLSRMHEDPEYWVSVKTVANLTKIRSLTENEQTVLDAIKESDMLILNNDETKVKRPSFVPPKPKQHKDLRRTVFLYGLAKDMANKKCVIKLCSEYGKVKNVYFDTIDGHSPQSPKDFNFQTNKNEESNNVTVNNESNQEGEGPDRDVALVLMTKRFGGRLIRQSSASSSTHAAAIASAVGSITGNTPRVSNATTTDGNQSIQAIAPTTTPVGLSQDMLNGGIVPPSPSPLHTHPIPNPNGNPLDFSHLRSCFVVFESQSQANKLVKVRSRAQDGIRAMHQYDFNKARKKVAAAKAKGISPVFSPAHIALALSPNQDTSKILSNTVNITHTPKERDSVNGVNNITTTTTVNNGLLSPAMNVPRLSNTNSNISNLSNGSNISSNYNKRYHSDSGESFVSQGSQIGNTNISLPARNDVEWQLKQENFELQRANLTLQQALQQNIETMKQMQQLYMSPNHGNIINNSNNFKNNKNKNHNRNHKSYHNRSNLGTHLQNSMTPQATQQRRHTFDTRPHTTKHGSKNINLHFGDWRHNNTANINNNNNSNNDGIRKFTIATEKSSIETKDASVAESQIGKFRANKSNPQRMQQSEISNLKNNLNNINTINNINNNGKLFLELEGTDEPIAPSNTPLNLNNGLLQQYQLPNIGVNGNNNGQYFSPNQFQIPQYGQTMTSNNGVAPVVAVNDANLQHVQQQQQQQQQQHQQHHQ